MFFGWSVLALRSDTRALRGLWLLDHRLADLQELVSEHGDLRVPQRPLVDPLILTAHAEVEGEVSKMTTHGDADSDE